MSSMKISVNNKDFQVWSPTTAAGIAAVVGNGRCHVYKEGGSQGPDIELEWDATINLRDGDAFFTVPYASFGTGQGEDGAAMGG